MGCSLLYDDNCSDYSNLGDITSDIAQLGIVKSECCGGIPSKDQFELQRWYIA